MTGPKQNEHYNPLEYRPEWREYENANRRAAYFYRVVCNDEAVDRWQKVEHARLELQDMVREHMARN